MQPRSFGTHDGAFHADEVTACAILLLFDLIDKDKIFRSRDPKILDKCEYVCDVGGIYNSKLKRFDHHQKDYIGPLSSAGMILLYLKNTEFIQEELYHHFNRVLVAGVDAHDNGNIKIQEGICSFSQVVTNFLPIDYSSKAKERMVAFFEAVDFVCGHLKRVKNRFFYSRECREKIQDVMKKNQIFLEFDESLPWIDNFFDLNGEKHPALFVIMPAGDHWKLRGIPPNRKDRMNVRIPLPEKWAGLRDEELQNISNIPGAIFCHKGKFISIWETKKDAMQALHEVLRQNGKSL